MSLEEELKLLVKDRTKSQKLWGRCPQDLQIAAYVDGTVDGATRQSLERHFSDCARCLNQVSFLVRAHQERKLVETPITVAQMPFKALSRRAVDRAIDVGGDL